jgi:hypothetical protein
MTTSPCCLINALTRARHPGNNSRIFSLIILFLFFGFFFNI